MFLSCVETLSRDSLAGGQGAGRPALLGAPNPYTKDTEVTQAGENDSIDGRKSGTAIRTGRTWFPPSRNHIPT